MLTNLKAWLNWSLLVTTNFPCRHADSTLSSLALAVWIKQHPMETFCLAGMLTMDGRCKTLDATADGYVRAEACIVMCLTADLAVEPETATGSGPGVLGGCADSAAIVLLGSFVNQVMPSRHDLPGPALPTD